MIKNHEGIMTMNNLTSSFMLVQSCLIPNNIQIIEYTIFISVHCCFELVDDWEERFAKLGCHYSWKIF